MRNEWGKKWTATPLYSQSKAYLEGPDPSAKDTILAFPKHITRIIIQCITGHSVLPSHLNKMGIATPSLCKFCQEEDLDTHHLLTNCPALEKDRVASWGPFIRDATDYTLKNFLLGLKSFISLNRIYNLFQKPHISADLLV